MKFKLFQYDHRGERLCRIKLLSFCFIRRPQSRAFYAIALLVKERYCYVSKKCCWVEKTPITSQNYWWLISITIGRPLSTDYFVCHCNCSNI